MNQAGPLSEIAEIISGFAFKSTWFGNGNDEIIRISDIQGGQVLREKAIQFDSRIHPIPRRYQIQEGDILMALSGATTGKIGIAQKKDQGAYLNQRIAIIRGKNQINSRFLKYVFSGNRLNTLLLSAGGAAQPNLSPKDLAMMQIPIPQLEEQKRIAVILDKADAVRRKRQQTIELSEQLLRSVFLDMFGDPVTNSKDWKQVLFSSVGALERGKSKHRPRNDPILLGGKYPLIQTGDIANSKGYINGYNETYSEIGLKQSKLWSIGTLCITIAANIAKTAILEIDACFPDSIVGFKSNGAVTIEYVQHWLGFLQKIIEESAPESAQKNINLEILRNLKMPLPDIQAQQKFSDIVQRINKQKKLYKSYEKSANILFNSLSQKAFSGELSKQLDKELA